MFSAIFLIHGKHIDGAPDVFGGSQKLPKT
jgi:hypothetical protein